MLTVGTPSAHARSIHQSCQVLVEEMCHEASIAIHQCCTLCKENVKKQEGDEGIWLGVEITFGIVFLIECVMKLGALGKAYFKEAWNVGAGNSVVQRCACA